MSKTALDIDRELAGQAQEILGTPTLTATVNQALHVIVDQHLIERSLELLKDVDYALADRFDKEGD